MSIFDWLLVGHFVGDWLLQSDWMALGKRRALFTWPGFIHFTIYTIVILVVLRLANGQDTVWLTYLIVGGAIFISHWVIDATSMVDSWMRTYKQGPEFVRIIVDQTLHLLVLALVVTVLLCRA